MGGNAIAQLKRYGTLLSLFTKFDFYWESAYGINFLSSIFGKILRVILILVFFRAVTVQVPDIPQWGEAELYILAGTFYITDLLASILFHRNLLFHLPYAIQDGSFDRILVKPIPQLFHTAFQRIDVADFFSLLPFVLFWWYLAQQFDFPVTALSVLGYIFFVGIALLFIFSLVLILGSLSFWIVKGDGFGRMVDHATGAARFPIDLFPRRLKLIFFYILPVAILSTIPTQVLLGFAKPFDLFYVILFTALFFCCSLLVFRRGIRQYQSSSS